MMNLIVLPFSTVKNTPFVSVKITNARYLPQDVTSAPSSSPHQDIESLRDPLQVRAICDYQGHRKTVLSFKKDDAAALISKSPTGWWCIKLQGHCGWVPGNYWQVMEVSHMMCHMICIASASVVLDSHQCIKFCFIQMFKTLLYRAVVNDCRLNLYF